MRSTLTPLFLALAALFLLPATVLAYHAHPRDIEPPRARPRFRPTREARFVHPTRSRVAPTRHAVAVKPSKRAARNTERLLRTKHVVVKPHQGRVRRIETAHTLAPATPAAASVPVSVVSVIREDAVHPRLPGVEDLVATAEIVPGLYDGRGHLNVPAALRGSHEVLIHQNLMAEQDGLTRVEDDEDLFRMREKKMLVALPVNEGLHIDERLPVDRRFCRPWVAQFLLAAGRAHYAQFHVPLQINSAVRTVSFQLRLMRTNGNAAQADGEAASPHLTGQAVDIGKKGMSMAEIAWMRLYLTPLLDDGRIDVEEEFQQACFHLSVYKKYAPVVPMQKIAVTHRQVTAALASTLE